MDWIATPDLLKRQRTDLRYIHERQLRCVTWRALAECDRGEPYINAAERQEAGNEPEVQSDGLAFELYRRTRTPQSCSVLDRRITISYFEPSCGGEQYNQWILPDTNVSWVIAAQPKHTRMG
jgi:hypothetical protein